MNLETNIFHQYPILGFIVSGGTVAAAEAAKYADAEIPTIIMQLFQIAAWSSAIIVGMITVHGWYNKNFKNTVHIND